MSRESHVRDRIRNHLMAELEHVIDAVTNSLSEEVSAQAAESLGRGDERGPGGLSAGVLGGGSSGLIYTRVTLLPWAASCAALTA